jgi:hypothetical protein
MRCRDARKPALWSIKQRLLCNDCYEIVVEHNLSIDVDDIQRLSDSMADFEVSRARKPKSGHYAAATAAV